MECAAYEIQPLVIPKANVERSKSFIDAIGPSLKDGDLNEIFDKKMEKYSIRRTFK